MKTIGKITAVLFVFILLSTVPVVSSNGDDGRPGSISFRSFDMDGDRIDDRLVSGNIEFPVWTFVHASTPAEIHEVENTIRETGAEPRETYDIIPVVSTMLTSMGQVRSLADSSHVEVIELQGTVVPLLDVSGKAIKANPSQEYSPKTARDLGMNGKGITIAVIDSGVDNEHPTLTGSFIAGADFTLLETPLTPRDGSHDPDDRSGHGTGVASIALGRGDNDGNMKGVAPSAGLIDLKVIGALSQSLNQNSILDSIQWCADNRQTSWGDGSYQGVDVVSISLGISNEGGAVVEALDGLVDLGVVVVQSSGNSGQAYGTDTGNVWADRSIIVGVVDDQGTIDRQDDVIWSMSTYGPRTDDGDSNPFDELKPDVVAPGVSITFASSSRTSLVQGANGWSSGSGTSYSAPHVSGTVALMLQAKGSLAPDETTNPISRILHQTSEPRGEPYDESLSPLYNEKYGYGILDAYEAVRGALTYSPINHRPEISYFAVEPNITTAGSTCRVRVVAIDVDEEPLTFELTADGGSLTGDGPLWDWTAPDQPGKYYFNLEVSDTQGGKDLGTASVIVNEGLPNRPPIITSFRSGNNVLSIGGTTDLKTVAVDQDDDDLTYEYVAKHGDIEGDGEEVQYTAPNEPVRDTITVTVSDGKGGTDSRSLEIDIREVNVNTPPVITLLTIEPGVIDSNTSGMEVKLYAQVEDPDGLVDISQVIADLTSIGGSSGVEMVNDGVPPDVQAGDLEYTLLLQGIEDLGNGTYSIKVTVYDLAGDMDTSSVSLVVDIPSQSSQVMGSQGGMDTGLVVIVVIIILLIVLGLVGMTISRSRLKRRTPPAVPPYGYPQSQYQQMNMGNQPRFQPVNRR